MVKVNNNLYNTMHQVVVSRRIIKNETKKFKARRKFNYCILMGAEYIVRKYTNSMRNELNTLNIEWKRKMKTYVPRKCRVRFSLPTELK